MVLEPGQSLFNLRSRKPITMAEIGDHNTEMSDHNGPKQAITILRNG
jgi:hypothetical protein